MHEGTYFSFINLKDNGVLKEKKTYNENYTTLIKEENLRQWCA